VSNNSTPTNSSRYASLDILRGFAAVWVFTYHLHPSETFIRTFPRLAAFYHHGDLAVAAFFVISGYCLMASLRSALRRNETASQFLRRRVTRIFPPFWLSIAVVVAVPFAVELISSFKAGVYTAPDTRFADFTLADWFMLATMTRVFTSAGEHLQSTFTAVNAIYWTLAIEVQFYFIMSAAVACGKKWSWLLIAVTVAGFAAACLPMSFRTGLFLPWWPTFAFGIGLFLLFEQGKTPAALSRAAAATLLALWVGAIIILINAYPRLGPNEGYRYLVFAAWTAVALWPLHRFDDCVATAASSRHRLIALAGRSLMLLGAMSYSIYLVHGKLCWI